MNQIIEDLFKFDRQLLGVGYDNSLDYIKMHVPLEVLEFPTGQEVGDWKIPPEWTIRDGYIKFNGEKLCDFKKDPLCVSVYSLPVNKKVDLTELKKHLSASEEKPDDYEYDFRFYDRDWGFSLPSTLVKKLEEGEYEVFIDAEDKPGVMKVGVHTIKGKSEREILLFAHLDHPHQANDNLSGVACLMDLIPQLKDRFDHTIKVIFCPETIGSIAYATTQDISKVDWVLALDAIGNDNSLLFQIAYDTKARINNCLHLAVASQGITYRKGKFRLTAGSDEYYFNDPKVGIPALFLSRLPYPEYHTSADKPSIVLESKLKEVQKVILKTIEFYEKDYIPKLLIKGVVHRSKYGVQTFDRLMNLELDHLFFSMDGTRYLSDLIIQLGIGFEWADSVIKKLGNNVEIVKK